MSSPTINKDDKEIAFLEEVKTADFLIREGLISFRCLKDDVDRSHLPILLLSNGFERLLKMIICLSCLEKNPIKPNFGCIRTHDVKKLLERVIKIAKEWRYGRRCMNAKKDMAFLENCKDLQELIMLLTKFGDKSGRYCNIDLIIGDKKNYVDPSKAFIAYFDKKMTDGISDPINHITTVLQRFARALCRMFIWGEVGQMGKNVGAIIEDFLCLNDEELGQVQSKFCE